MTEHIDKEQARTEICRKVIVTGGSRGIGAACVRRFASNGDRVAFIYRSDEAAAACVSAATGAAAIQADISDAEQCREAARRAMELLGGADILVNCAGIAQIKLFNDLSEAELCRMINTDLLSAMRMTQEVTNEMIRRHSGRIVNIGSVWGARGASCEVAYSTAKAGIRGFTQALSKELGPSGINVNCVEPGVIETDMNASLSAEVTAGLIDETPLCRLGTPEDVAAAVFFLSGNDSSFITGAILPVDGGFPA